MMPRRLLGESGRTSVRLGADAHRASYMASGYDERTCRGHGVLHESTQRPRAATAEAPGSAQPSTAAAAGEDESSAARPRASSTAETSSHAPLDGSAPAGFERQGSFRAEGSFRGQPVSDEAHLATSMFEWRGIYRGYVDDERNTDNAWVETTAMLFAIDRELSQTMCSVIGEPVQSKGSYEWVELCRLGDETAENQDSLEVLRGFFPAHRAWVWCVRNYLVAGGNKHGNVSGRKMLVSPAAASFLRHGELEDAEYMPNHIKVPSQQLPPAPCISALHLLLASPTPMHC